MTVRGEGGDGRPRAIAFYYSKYRGKLGRNWAQRQAN